MLYEETTTAIHAAKNRGTAATSAVSHMCALIVAGAVNVDEWRADTQLINLRGDEAW